MYCSLTSVDIIRADQETGEKQFVLTDQRTAEEIEAQWELSVVFGLIRVFTARRMAEQEGIEAEILFRCEHRPPESLRNILTAAGAAFDYGPGYEIDDETDPTLLLNTAVQTAFADLADAVAAEFGVELTPAGVAKVESRLAKNYRPPDGDDVDECDFWSSVVKLGSLAGEVLRRTRGGRWTPVASGTLPFAVSIHHRGETATVNVLGKAVKFFVGGPDESPAVFVKSLLQTG